MGMKKRLLVLLWVLVFSVSFLAVFISGGEVEGQELDLFFSEYIEGSSNNKALEIYNPTDAAIELLNAVYKVSFFLNGNNTAYRSIELKGKVPAKGVFVLYHVGIFNQQLGNAGLKVKIEGITDSDWKQESSGNWYNGNDAIVLYKNDIPIDRIGRVGEDPEPQSDSTAPDKYKGWVGNKVQTANRTLVRKPTVTVGDKNTGATFDPSEQWLVFPENTSEYLGTHGQIATHQVTFDLGPHVNLLEGSLEQEVYHGQAARIPHVEPLEGYSIVGWKQDSSQIDSDLTVEADVRSWTEPGLFFSKYIEGTSNNKALELFNGTSQTIDLDDENVSIQIYFDGASSPGHTIQLGGTIPSMGTYLLCHSESNEEIRNQSDKKAGGNWFNGNDAVALMRNGQMVDCIGLIGQDPDPRGVAVNMIGWNDKGVQTGNRTLIRKPDVGEGVTKWPDYFDPSLQWLVEDQDSTGNLGSHDSSVIHTIHFLEGTSGHLTGRLYQTVYSGQSAELPSAQAFEGYEFFGWQGNYSNVQQDEIVTALWKVKTYQITFDTDGGSQTEPITLQAGSRIEPPADPVREGYTFLGWQPALPSAMPEGGLQVKAQWRVNQYTITFDTGAGSAVTPLTLDYGSKIPIPGSPQLADYEFAGWMPDMPQTMPAQDLTVKAVWRYLGTQSPAPPDKVPATGLKPPLGPPLMLAGLSTGLLALALLRSHRRKKASATL